MPRRGLLDMDGVIVDFIAGVSDLHGRPNPYQDPATHGKVTFEFWGLSREECWGPVDAAGADFWAALPKTPEADRIVNLAIRRFGLENVGILSNPAFGRGCIQGKMEWLNRYYPDLVDNAVFTAAKHLMAAPGNILIDDQDGNVDSFIKAGGEAVLVPRPWNTLHRRVDMPVWTVIQSLNRIEVANANH
jgi:5'(3')-deoxyribonucleotidase